MSNQYSNYTEVTTQYIQVENTQYAYRSFGKPSEVPIICLQHFTGTLDNWDPIIMNGLAQERQVIAIDNTGVGNSGGETPDNVLGMSRDAIKIITALGIKKCDLFGYSLGGFVAQTIVDQQPNLVRKMILIGTAPQGAKALHSFKQLVDKALTFEGAERFLFIFATPTENSRGKVKAALGRLFSRTKDRDKEASVPAMQAQTKALVKWGTDPATINLSKISQPVLIIQGSHDEMMGSITSYELFTQIPNSVLTYYPDAAHGSLFQYPELFVNQANFFLNNFQ